ncbi:MAG: hypothetical protein CMO41_05075, partial [Verrucomicrobiales bacterium]|nr:hypothetical protein [Verrucomicrobiales bacterium]
RIKSPTLYLTELQAQCSNLGFLSDLHGLLIRFVLAVTTRATRKAQRWLDCPLHKSAHIRKISTFWNENVSIAS